MDRTQAAPAATRTTSTIEPASARATSSASSPASTGRTTTTTSTDDFISAIDTAFHDGSTRFRLPRTPALVSTANAYDGVDATSATAMPELDPMNNVR